MASSVGSTVGAAGVGQISAAKSWRDPPGQQPGDVLVAHVLVAEPRRLGEALAHDAGGVVGRGVVRVGEPERHEHRGGSSGADRGLERVDGLVGADPVGPVEVLVLDEVEPDRGRVELGEGEPILLPAAASTSSPGAKPHVASQRVGGSG